MAIKINFDVSGNPEEPTLILAKKNGEKLGKINAKNIIVKGCADPEISFKVYKYDQDQNVDPLWEKISNFRLVWCKEWDTWFEITVGINESNNTIKQVSCALLGQAELSNIRIFNTEINTENDIAREDYVIPTILYNSEHPEASLLHRILEKAPHYKVTHVDATIAKIQRTFTFDDVSIYDVFKEIAEEIGCLFVLPSKSGVNGKLERTIEVYDMQSNCLDCNYRGEFTDECPECGSKNIKYGYGNDTTIFVSAEDLASEVSFSTDTGSVKNCFKLEAGDELMTATICNCNPNGTDYIWYITDETKADMSDRLVQTLNNYDTLYEYYQKSYNAPINDVTLNTYNVLVTKYQQYNPKLEKIVKPVVGYPALMTAYYNTIDLAIYLQSALMPDASMSETNAAEQAALLTVRNISPVAVTNLRSLSLATANSTVLAMAKAVVRQTYQVKVNTSDLSENVWTGNFIVTNYSDEEDTATSAMISIELTDDYQSYVRQKIEKVLSKENTDDVSITGLFKRELTSFSNEIKKYSLNSLNSFYNAAQSSIDILIEQGVADLQTWADKHPNLYEELYVPYYNKLKAIEAEVKIREDEINSIVGVYDNDGNLITQGTQNYIVEIIDDIQRRLDFQGYLGTDLWEEFCSFRREDKYANDNYISDGLNNAELFEKALEFLKIAEQEIYKSAELQHSISVDNLKNLLVIDGFQPIRDYFEIYNWIRVLIDGKVYKLRLLEYEIDYDNLENISVTFSDVLKIANGISDLEDVVSRSKSMAASYDSTKRQASQGADSGTYVKGWIERGLDATNVNIVGNADYQTQTWDSHGMMFRRRDPITDSFNDKQFKIQNNSIVFTTDNWKSIKAALGEYYYVDPQTNELKTSYGLNAETIVGKFIIGENLGIYSENNSLTFNKDGLKITNGVNTFSVDPNSGNLLTLSNRDHDILNVDEEGKLHIIADEFSLSSGDTITSIVEDAIEGQTQQYIFDKLTNKGESKGLTLIDGQLYVNATYMNTGELKVSNGDLETFYVNVDTGEVRIKARSFSLESGETIDSIAEEKASAAANAALKNAQDYANSAASNAVNAQTQDDILNRLTNGGVSRGLYMEDGQLYILFDYAKGGTLTLGGIDNQYGILRVLDENGELDGTWTSECLRMRGGYLEVYGRRYIGELEFDVQAKYSGGIAIFADDKDGVNKLIHVQQIMGQTIDSSVYAIAIPNYFLKGIVIGIQSDMSPTAVRTKYVMNDGWNPSGITERHIFYNDMYCSGHIRADLEISTKSTISADGDISTKGNINAIYNIRANRFYPGIPSDDFPAMAYIGCGRSADNTTDLIYIQDGALYSNKYIHANEKVKAPKIEIGSNGAYLSTGRWRENETILCQNGHFYVYGDIGCSGEKNRIVETDDFGTIAMNSIESTEPYFSDIGSGIVGDNGEITIFFDPIFAETIDMDSEYQVYITRTSKKVTDWVEKQCGYFIVYGEPGATFDWMITCKQRNYSSIRMRNISIDISLKEEKDEIIENNNMENINIENNNIKNTNIEGVELTYYE